MKRLWPILLLLVSACSTLHEAPITGVPSGKAHVYIYRRTVAFGPASVHVYDGQTDKGWLISGNYLDYLTDPGPRAFRALVPGSTDRPYATTLESGRTYYLLVYILGDQLHGEPAITPMDPATGSAQIKSLKLVTPP